MGDAMGKAAGYHGRLIFLAKGATRGGQEPYVDLYVGIVRSRRIKMSRRTIGVNLVCYLSERHHKIWAGKNVHLEWVTA